MTDIKMVATDIDGTILCYDKTHFSTNVFKCIKELDKKGVKVILVTGRMHKAAKKIADMLDLKAPIVSYQGALVRNNSDNAEILYERYLDNEIASDILKWSKMNNISTNLYLNDELYVESKDEATEKYAARTNLSCNVVPFETLDINKVNKILLMNYNDVDAVSQWEEHLLDKYPELYIVKSTPYFCEICHKEATKGDGLAFLQNYYGIKKEETLSIGDHDNDIELLLAGGVKVAMGNASEELKKIADFVTDSVEDDGFVKAIDKFVIRGVNV